MLGFSGCQVHDKSPLLRSITSYTVSLDQHVVYNKSKGNKNLPCNPRRHKVKCDLHRIFRWHIQMFRWVTIVFSVPSLSHVAHAFTWHILGWHSVWTMSYAYCTKICLRGVVTHRMLSSAMEIMGSVFMFVNLSYCRWNKHGRNYADGAIFRIEIRALCMINNHWSAYWPALYFRLQHISSKYSYQVYLHLLLIITRWSLTHSSVI